MKCIRLQCSKVQEECLWMRIFGRISEISRVITSLYQTLISLCFVSSNLMITVSICRINMHLFQLFKILLKNVVNQIRTYLTGQYIISVNWMSDRVCRPHFLFLSLLRDSDMIKGIVRCISDKNLQY